MRQEKKEKKRKNMIGYKSDNKFIFHWVGETSHDGTMLFSAQATHNFRYVFRLKNISSILGFCQNGPGICCSFFHIFLRLFIE